MPDKREEFARLMQGVRDGSDSAIGQLLEYCEHHILRAVRTRLNRMLRSKFDSQDFVQAVWASFFGNLSIIKKFDTPEDIIRFLVRISSNKVVDETRRRLVSQQRNVNRERSLELLGDSRTFSLASKDPSPSEIASAKEQWDLVVKKQTQRNAKILEMRISGKTPKQIAEELNVHQRTVRRALVRISADFAKID